MLVIVPNLEEDLTESMLEESPGPHGVTSSPVTYRQVLYKGHSRHSVCHCWHVPKKYLFSSSASWGSRAFFEDSPQQSKETNRLLAIGTWLGGLFLAGLGWWRRAIILCPFFIRGMYGVVTGRFINFSSTFRQAGINVEPSPLYSPKLFAVLGWAGALGCSIRMLSHEPIPRSV
jgi:hypothetical protein